LQSKFFARQNSIFKDTKEKFGGKNYFANGRGPSSNTRVMYIMICHDKFLIFRLFLIQSTGYYNALEKKLEYNCGGSLISK
jgi:hypothetical protein